MNVDVQRLISDMSDCQLIEMFKELSEEISRNFCQDRNIVRLMIIKEFENRKEGEESNSISDLIII